MKTKQVQQRFPEGLLKRIDDYANENGQTRTGVINIMCQSFLDSIEIELLKIEVIELRKKIINIAMIREG